MEIQYLTYLRDNPKHYPNDSENQFTIEPISISEIETLETKYNNGIPFPKALRELLYLAGDFCYVLDYGLYDSQDEFQGAERTILANRDHSISRPFYVIDCYNNYDQFLFVHLDEGNDPPVYYFYFQNNAPNLLNQSLTRFIEAKIELVKQGINPF